MKTHKHFLLVLLCLFGCNILLHAQDKKTVTGVVRDSSGSALESATLAEKGTATRVVSNRDGSFSIRVVKGTKLMKFKKLML